jgi:hypothetical protein
VPRKSVHDVMCLKVVPIGHHLNVLFGSYTGPLLPQGHSQNQTNVHLFPTTGFIPVSVLRVRPVVARSLAVVTLCFHIYLVGQWKPESLAIQVDRR